MKVSRRLRLAFGAAIALLFTWLVLRNVHLRDLFDAFAGANYLWLCGAYISFAFGYAARIERWRSMLVAGNPQIRWRDCSGPLFAGFAVNNLFPFRVGDVLRCFAFNRTLGSTSGVLIATLFIERLFDLLMVVIFFGISIRLFGIDSYGLLGIGATALLAIAALISVALLLPSLLRPTLRLFAGLLSKLSPGNRARITGEVERSISTLEQMSGIRFFPRLFILSAFAWFAEGLVFYMSARSLPILDSPNAAWIALPVGTLSTLIPSTPGYIGTFDYFTVHAMEISGNSAIASTAYALLVHFVLWLPPTVGGGVYLALCPPSIRDVLRRRTE